MPDDIHGNLNSTFNGTARNQNREDGLASVCILMKFPSDAEDDASEKNLVLAYIDRAQDTSALVHVFSVLNADK